MYFAAELFLYMEQILIQTLRVMFNLYETMFTKLGSNKSGYV